MKILEDSITVDGHVLHRIQADRDIPYHGVKVGDIGGWVEKPNNLQDDAWVTGYLYGDAVACGNALIGGMVFDNAFVQKNAVVQEYAKVYGNANIGGNAMICDHAVVYGDAQVMGYAGVSGNARISDFVHVTGRAYIGGDVRLKDKVIVEGDVTIGNHAIIKDNVIVKGYGYICNHLYGDLVINGEDPDFRLAFPYSISGKCEISKNEDIIFVATGEMSYVYIKPLNKGFGNPAVLQKVKELCIS